ncbi:VOC family protein [Arundinibacter roseus]|uniref:VOC family protein n=1 Tax=Arundinibacter roseus TaxID=2070510 RepID=A0A4R4KB40_9BACT|nr:VOC family protein [Arundinibacter roseus]TDB65067.1 VOC family protein [Arundinibacter roseus]
MASVHTYLNFNGNTEEAFTFYKSVFGGEFMALMRFKDVEGSDQMPPDAQEKIMHVALSIAPGFTLMGTDALESMGQFLTFGNNMQILLQTDSKEETTQFFHALSEGGTIEMNLEDTFWGDYFGAFEDQFGVHWMISYTYPKEA